MLESADAGAAGHTGRSRLDRPSLARCISVTTSEFAQQFWSSAPLLSDSTELMRDFSDLFSTEAVDELVSERGLRTPFLRMAKNGSVLAASNFTRSGGVGATIGDQVADDKVLAELAGGATLVLQALHRTWPPLIRFGSELAVELGHPVQINAYITPPQNQGFAAHYDTHDVFVLQVAGSKRWTIHPPVIDDPLPDQTWEQRKSQVAARAAEPPLIDTVLQPGDALYLPRGFLHSAVAQGEVSIHLTVGVHPLTAFDLARELISAAASDRELRRSLPMGIDVTDTMALTEHLQDAGRRLVSAVNRAAPDHLAGVASRIGRQQVNGSRPAPLAPLAQLAALRELSAETNLQLRAGLRPLLRATGDRLSMDVNGTTISWPAQTGPALELALSGEVFQPTECKGLDPDEQLVVARRLLREGIVVPAGVDADRQPG